MYKQMDSEKKSQDLIEIENKEEQSIVEEKQEQVKNEDEKKENIPLQIEVYSTSK